MVVENAKKTNDGAFVRGVIYGSSIKGGKIIGIKRLQPRRGGEKIDSLSVLPDEVTGIYTITVFKMPKIWTYCGSM